MHRSSEAISKLASALSKAQIEISNPQKSLVGTAARNGSGESHTFKYASLASGLEIVRQTLGSHEIAVIQTTDIDRTGGTVNLSTVLIHASGEWISSDWPVCPLSDISIPRRMGAALTYARRYALFTLVGIAGEDDLDSAPDLTVPKPKALPPTLPPVNREREHSASPRAEVSHEESAILCSNLRSEIESLTSAAEVENHAAKFLKAKNNLQTKHAQEIEAAFQAKLGALETAAPPGEADSHLETAAKVRNRKSRKESTRPSRLAKIDKSVLTFAEPRRLRDKDHLRFVAQQPCLICGRSPSDAHHLRFAQPRALGLKSSDEFTVPLCRTHHRENHQRGNEREWWAGNQLDPMPIAVELWKRSHNV